MSSLEAIYTQPFVFCLSRNIFTTSISVSDTQPVSQANPFKGGSKDTGGE